MKIGDKYPLIALIDRVIANRKSEVRKYLGASEIGEPCYRKLWYGYNYGKKDMSPRIRRIMDFGHYLEDYVIKLLKESGVTVYDRSDDGTQFRFVDFNGRYSGGCDAIIRDIPDSDRLHVLEIKSANKKRFEQFKKLGVKNFEPKYWAQIHVYMHYFKIDRGLFLIINKDDCELYYERCTYDEKTALMYNNKALQIVDAIDPPDRHYSKETDFHCKMCDYKQECWK